MTRIRTLDLKMHPNKFCIYKTTCSLSPFQKIPKHTQLINGINQKINRTGLRVMAGFIIGF